MLGGFFGLFLSRERTKTQKKKKKEEEKMAEVPTFKLVLVGDGGTGESFSFYDDDEKKSDEIFSFYASLSFSFFLSKKRF